MAIGFDNWKSKEALEGAVSAQWRWAKPDCVGLNGQHDVRSEFGERGWFKESCAGRWREGQWIEDTSASERALVGCFSRNGRESDMFMTKGGCQLQRTEGARRYGTDGEIVARGRGRLQCME